LPEVVNNVPENARAHLKKFEIIKRKEKKSEQKETEKNIIKLFYTVDLISLPKHNIHIYVCVCVFKF